MSGAEASAPELTSGVALPPPDDEYVSSSGNELQMEGTLSGRYDSYDGVIVDPCSLPSDGSTFKNSLMASIAQWKRERKHGIWLKLPIENVNLVEPAVAAGFRYHHAEPTYLVLTLWLPDIPCTLPPNASHQVGIGAFVLNDKNEILAVQEKNGPLKGTGVWKMPTGLTNQGEDVFEGAIREVKEETGVDAKFLEVVGFRSQRLRQLRYLKLLDMGSGVRWKSREAAAVALEEPVSSLYEQMQEWEPVEALLAHSCVILSIDVSKAQVLNRACFGKPIYAATSPQRSASSASTRSPWFVEVDAEPENARLFQLGLEEAFFLASHLGCIVICKQSLEGREALSTEEVWRCMQRSQAEFGYLYTAYAHLRAKQWVVRSGIQYGADFMGYAVVVMVEGQEERVKTWTEVQAMNRLCGSVAKTLLLLHIIPKREGADMSSAGCEGDFTVEAVEVRRWLPEKNREESDRPI